MVLRGDVLFYFLSFVGPVFCAASFCAEKAAERPAAVLLWSSAVIHENDPLFVTFTCKSEETNALSFVRFDVEGRELDRAFAAGDERKDGAETIVSFQISSRGAERIRFFSRRKPTEAVAAIRLLRPEDEWPAVRFESGRMLQADTGETLVLVARRMDLKPDRTCVLVKGLLRKTTVAPVEFPEAQRLLLAPVDIARTVWNEREKKSEYEFDGLMPEKCFRQNRFRMLSNADARGAPPILGTVAAAAKIAAVLSKSGSYPYVVLWLPGDDLVAPTETLLYQTAIEHLLARLANAGVRRLIVIPPVAGGVSAAKLDLLWAAVREVVTAWGGEFAEWDELRDPNLWRLDGVQPPNAAVYGTRLNAEGRKKIGKKLAELLD